MKYRKSQQNSFGQKEDVMEKLREYLEKKKIVCAKRAEKLDDRIIHLRKAYKTYESYNVYKLDLHTRQQYQDAVCKQNELYAVVGFIEDIEQKFFKEQKEVKEKEEDKRCWNCEHIDDEYNCWCGLTGENVIIDMTVADTIECDSFKQTK